MTSSTRRLCLGILLGSVLALSGAGLGAEESGTVDVPLPAGVRPFKGAMTLRYGGFENFTFVFRSDIEAGEARTRSIAEGWVMEGTMRPGGEEAEWSYHLSNIGRDGVLRERGALQVRTDPWGEVRDAHVLLDRWAPGSARPRMSADSLFDERDLRFPLCCCPRGPVRMGDAIVLPRGGDTMPATWPAGSVPPRPPGAPIDMTLTMRSVVAGVLDQEGRRYLVVRHAGTASATSAEGRMAIRSSGYSLIDTQTCLPRRSIWVNRGEMEGAQAKPFAIIHSNEARF